MQEHFFDPGAEKWFKYHKTLKKKVQIVKKKVQIVKKKIIDNFFFFFLTHVWKVFQMA